MDLFLSCVFNAHYLGPFAFLFSTSSAAPRIHSSRADKLLPFNRCDLLQGMATSAFVVSNLFRRGDDGDSDGGKLLLLSAWNTGMHESNAACTVQQRSHRMIIGDALKQSFAKVGPVLCEHRDWVHPEMPPFQITIL